APSLLADHLQCPQEITQALSAALGERLRYVVVHDVRTALEAIAYLRTTSAGRATLISKVPPRIVGVQPEIPAVPGVHGLLLDLVQCSTGAEALVRHLIGDVLIVEDFDVAIRLRDAGLWPGVIATLQGEVIRLDGTMTGGSGEDEGAHLLEVRRE